MVTSVTSVKGNLSRVTKFSAFSHSVIGDLIFNEETSPWIQTDSSNENLFFALFGDDGKPVTEDGGRLKKATSQLLKIPGKYKLTFKMAFCHLRFRPLE